ncbi:MAG TPA: YggT family protein [Candidatus Acidoferrales bacterium]|nr:YggT family protein [Candidatus Acidoferrales bacterium]
MNEEYPERPSENTPTVTRQRSTDLSDEQYNTVKEPQTYQQKKAVVRSYNIIWFFIGLIVALLAFRFVFELLAANPGNAFVQMIYTLSYPFAQPFRSIFGTTNVAYSTFDWSLLVAMFVYVLIGFALIQLLRIIRPMTPEDVNHRIRTV